MKIEFTVQKRTWEKWAHEVRFFERRPTMLVACGIFREGNDGIEFCWRFDGKLHIAFITFEELDGRPIRPFLKRYAQEHDND